MVFSSPIFLFIFLPIVLGVYFLSGKYRNIWLLLASLFFYSWGEPVYVLLMVGSVVFNYFAGILLEKAKKRQKLILILSLIFNLGMLVIFKYTGFFAETINSVFRITVKIPEIQLPIGISFYTFQILSYVIDVYRKEVPAQRSIVDLGLYISLFPQLIAGPIVRYTDINNQIKQRHCSFEKIHDGIIRFAVGFTKKILVADMAGVISDKIFAADTLNASFAWMGIVAYAVQIYYDFSGYSDMAIGLGKMLGFDFAENFNYPYISQSVQEFWRRWHISLSTWFRDYLYIPLGGSRRGVLRTYINTVIVFFFTGLWHGASWNFIVWGLFYAVFLLIERAFFKKLLEKIPKLFRHAYVLIVVIIGWVFFRAENLSHAVGFIKSMFLFSGSAAIEFVEIPVASLWAVAFGIIFSVPLVRWFTEKYKKADGFCMYMIRW